MLSQDIVIVNEFSVKNQRSGHGSRGSTPGHYVLRYMARDDAVERLSFSKKRELDSEDELYRARERASEYQDSMDGLRTSFRRFRASAGVAFGNGRVSLTDQRLRELSQRIQSGFDAGKTVLKTVLSFSQDYLKDRGILPQDFQFQHKGDYKGHVDQMKLRLGIMYGIDRIKRHFDKLEYIGCIQLDTAHVHCHLSMIDMGNGRQKGKLSKEMKEELRRGVDEGLLLNQPVPQDSMSFDKENVHCFFKAFCHKSMLESSLPQLLFACLPDDKSLWYASCSQESMKRPNELLREFVEDLSHDESFSKALASRRGRDRTIERENLIRDCMDGVYEYLKSVPVYDKHVDTPFLKNMSKPYGTFDHSPGEDFCFRLRSYKTRLDDSIKNRRRFHEEKKAYERETEKSPDSKVLYDFFVFEEEYQDKLMCKYLRYLHFKPPLKRFAKSVKKLRKQEALLDRLRKFRDDPRRSTLSNKDQERYGRETYGIYNSRYDLASRIRMEEKTFQDMKDDFSFRLQEYGLFYEDGNFYDESRGNMDNLWFLDLHHMDYDFSEDKKVPNDAFQAFYATARRRAELYRRACDYLKTTGQDRFIESLPGKDIEKMLSQAQVIYSKRRTGQTRDVFRTVSLDKEYLDGMEQSVYDTLSMF